MTVLHFRIWHYSAEPAPAGEIGCRGVNLTIAELPALPQLEPNQKPNSMDTFANSWP